MKDNIKAKLTNLPKELAEKVDLKEVKVIKEGESYAIETNGLLDFVAVVNKINGEK